MRIRSNDERGNLFGDAREMAEEQTKRRPLISQFVRPGLLRSIGQRVDSNHCDAFPAHSEDHCLVPEKSRVLEVANLGGP